MKYNDAEMWLFDLFHKPKIIKDWTNDTIRVREGLRINLQEFNAESAQINSTKIELDNLQNETNTRKQQIVDWNKKISTINTQHEFYILEKNTLPEIVRKKEIEQAILCQKQQKLANLKLVSSGFIRDTDPIVLMKESCIKKDELLHDKACSIYTNINCRDALGKTALMYAVANNFHYGVKKLLALNSDIGLLDNHGNNVLHIAVLSNNKLATQELLAINSKLAHVGNEYGKLPLYIALEQNNTNLVDILFLKPNAVKCFAKAIELNNQPIVQSLLSRDAEFLRYTDHNGKTPLALAFEYNNIEIIKLLLLCNANMSDALHSSKVIKCLNFEDIKIGSENIHSVADAISTSKSIKFLNLSSTQLTNSDTKLIALGLKENHSIRYLKITDNNIGYDGTKLLTDNLNTNHSLRIINLSNNNIQDAGAIFIAKLLEINPKLIGVNLSKNQITDVGAIFIANSIGCSKSLSNIDLSKNEIGLKGAEALADSLTQNISLIYLNLVSNNISKIGVEYFVESIKLNNSLLSLSGIKHPQITAKISNNNASMKANISKIKSSELVNDAQKLFILFKQIENQETLAEFGESNSSMQQFLFSKLCKNAKQSSAINEYSFDNYGMELLAQLQDCCDDFSII